MVFMRTCVGRRLPRDEQGAVAVLTALLMVVLTLFAAIVVDLGNARDVRRQSQNAADAASLAAANVLYPDSGRCSSGPRPCITDAVAEAKKYALKNFQVSDLDWAACTAPAGSALAYVPGVTSCISFDSDTSPTLVRVYLPTRSVPTFFARIIGNSSIPVGSSAQAQLGTATTCSLCFMGNVDAGNGDFSVIGGSIAVNGDVTAGPGSYWTATSIGIVGDFDNQAHPTPLTSKVDPFTDPLADKLPLPVDTSRLSVTPKTDPCGVGSTHGPGFYTAPVGYPAQFPNGPGCILQPGLYVISNKWTLGNFPLVAAPGVTFYVRGSLGELDFKNGPVTLTAPTAAEAALTGGIKGYAILYDSTTTHDLGLQGNGDTMVTGVVYAPGSILKSNGTADIVFSGGPIVLGGAYENGTGSTLRLINPADVTVGRTLLHLNQ